jgi:hypothetical protein
MQYVDFLLNKDKKKRMTLDDRQDVAAPNLKQAVEEHLSLIGYRIW